MGLWCSASAHVNAWKALGPGSFPPKPPQKYIFINNNNNLCNKLKNLITTVQAKF